MKKYKVLGGGEITASSNLSVVMQMREQSSTPSHGIYAFMKQVASQCTTQKGPEVEVRIDTYENFVNDLLKHNFLQEV